jgi:chaperone modulatory protein CbpM
MTMETREFLHRARLGSGVLPEQEAGQLNFSEIDLARAQFIGDLRHDFGIDDDAITIVLDLVDQLYALRRRLGDLAAAVGGQPEHIRRRIIADLGKSGFDQTHRSGRLQTKGAAETELRSG